MPLPPGVLTVAPSHTDLIGRAMAETVRQDAAQIEEEPHRLPIKTLVSASIGNAVEWFDWTVYATFLVFFAGQFFPSENEALALIGASSAYALAFFFRPLGGLLLGRFADLRVVGWILMIVGALGVVLELAIWAPRRRRTVTTDAYGAPAPPATRTTTDETY